MGFLKSRGAIVAVLALLGVASALLGATATNLALHRVPARALTQFITPDPQRLFGKPNLRLLVVGLDYDYTNQDEETSAHSRSDIIMAVRLDLASHKIYELSVPRDMVATMPNGSLAKINQAQSDGGIAESKRVVAGWLGIPGFDRYVVLRIDTMKDVIDALGGVTVDVKNSDALKGRGPNGPIDYDDSWGHLHVHLKPGLQHLDGEHAVGYARFRHDWCSDPCRIMRQQQVVRAIAQRVRSAGAGIALRLPELVAVLRRDVDTDLRPDEELSLAAAFAHLAPSDIFTSQVPYMKSVHLPGYGDSIVADEREKHALVTRYLAPSPSLSASPTHRRRVTSAR